MKEKEEGDRPDGTQKQSSPSTFDAHMIVQQRTRTNIYCGLGNIKKKGADVINGNGSSRIRRVERKGELEDESGRRMPTMESRNSRHGSSDDRHRKGGRGKGAAYMEHHKEEGKGKQPDGVYMLGEGKHPHGIRIRRNGGVDVDVSIGEGSEDTIDTMIGYPGPITRSRGRAQALAGL